MMKLWLVFLLTLALVECRINKRASFSGCKNAGDNLSLGEESVIDNFRMRCTESGFEAISCQSSTGGEIAIGQEVTDGGMVRSCRMRGFRVQYDEWPEGVHPLGSPRGAKVPAASSNPAPVVVAQPRPAPASLPSPIISPSVAEDQPPPAPQLSMEPGIPSIPASNLVGGVLSQMGTDLKIDGVPAEFTGCLVENGQRYQVGETFRLGDAKWRCSQGSGVQPLACYTEIGGREVELAVGSKRTCPITGCEHSCVKAGNQIRLDKRCSGTAAQPTIARPAAAARPAPAPIPSSSGGSSSCTHSGQTYSNGQVWTTPSLFKVRCENGSVKPVACIADDGDEIPAGSEDVKNGLRRRCLLIAGGRQITYKSELVNGR